MYRFVTVLTVFLFLLGLAQPTTALARTCETYKGKLNLQDSRSAYPTEAYQPRGQPYMYIAWMWRETPVVTTNHTISVMRTRNMRDWENTCGQRINLPATLETAEVVDHAGMNEGLFSLTLSEDNKGRPVLSYNKIVKDPKTGKRTTQIINARLEEKGWVKYQMTNWTTVWEPEGIGSLSSDSYRVGHGGIMVGRDGTMKQRFSRAAMDTAPGSVWGTYEIADDANGVLRIVTTNNTAKAAAAPVPKVWTDNYYVEPYWPAKAILPGPQPENFVTKFGTISQASKAWDRWIPTRGNFANHSSNESAIFDSYTNTFYFWDRINRKKYAAKAPSFCKTQPCPMDAYNEPLVGRDDWGVTVDPKLGKPMNHSIAVFNPMKKERGEQDIIAMASRPTFERWLQYLLPGVTKIDAVNAYVVDNSRAFFSRRPDMAFKITWDALPKNRDLPYTCEGVPATTSKLAVDPVVACPGKFVRDLYFWSYNEKTQKWEKEFVDKVWGANVGFDLITFKKSHFIAYYNKDRYLTVATKNRGINPWKIKVFKDNQFAGWDSHNGITMFIDENHSIHLAANHHVSKLNYYFSPNLDIANLERVPVMVGDKEDKVTYPRFLRSPYGDMLFTYRWGGSGNGENLYNIYDPSSLYDKSKKPWHRFLNQPLIGSRK